MTNQNWDKGLMDKTADTYKVILRFLWDTPNATPKQINRIIGDDYSENTTYVWGALTKLRKFELVRQPYRGHYEITEKGMEVIGLTPKKPMLELPQEIRTKLDGGDIRRTVEYPPMTNPDITPPSEPLQAPTIVKVEEVDELPIVTKEITLKLKIIVEVM